MLGEALDIDPKRRRLTLHDGEAFDYDSLIVATGSKTSYFGNDQWREWAPSLKTVEEATAIRHKILFAFEAAERVTDPGLRQAWLTFVIVGGGPTGVELAGALGEIARHTLKDDFRSIRPEEARIVILDGSPRVLAHLPRGPFAEGRGIAGPLGRAGAHAASGWSKWMRTASTSRRPMVRITGWRRRPCCGRAAWLPQRSGGPWRIAPGRETDRVGRIRVNPDLTVPGYPEIYVVGDLADARQPDGSPLPGVAQVAMQGGAYAAHAIVERLNGPKELTPFHYHDKGDLAVIGRGAAVANIFGLHLSGLPAWLVWLFVHLMYLVEFRSRVLVFIQWGFQYLTFSRSAMLITGNAVPNSIAPVAPMKNMAEE